MAKRALSKSEQFKEVIFFAVDPYRSFSSACETSVSLVVKRHLVLKGNQNCK